MSFQNAAVFKNGNRILKNISVEWDDEKVYIKNRTGNKALIETFDIVELAGTAGDTMAWDIHDKRGTLVRLVAQTGCGCSGLIKPYAIAEGYSGALKRS